MKSLIRKAITSVVAVAALATMPGCTAEEFATTALVIGAVAIAADSDVSVDVRDSRHHRRGRGGYDRGGRGGYGRGGRGGGRHYAAPLAFGKKEFVSQDARVIRMADNFQIPHYAATYLVRAIVLAEQKDVSGVKDLGLEPSDMRDLYQGKRIDSEKVEALGSKLLLSPAATKQLIADLSADAQLEKAARGL